MSRRRLTPGSIFILMILLVCGCATVNYIGNSFDPTSSVDIYYSEGAITREYTVIGLAIGSSMWDEPDSELIRAKLIEVAKQRGADAILVTGIGKENVFMGGSSSGDYQINATYLKYR